MKFLEFLEARPQVPSQSRLDRLAVWLECEESRDFTLLVRSKIATWTAQLAMSHCQHAEDILANPQGSREDQEIKAGIARLAVCLQVIEEIKAEAERRTQEKEPAFEFLDALKLIK